MVATSAEGTGNPLLRDFLRSRRAKVTPMQVGIDPGAASRRVSGLRREEVAQLAGMSVDYYTRLERGRQLNVSEVILEALARALCLTGTEREHLFAVARPDRKGEPLTPPPRIRRSLQLVVDALRDSPALVLGRHLEVLASNHLARALYTDWNALETRDQNMAQFVFLDDAVRELYVDWESAARSVVAALNLAIGRHPHDAHLVELIGELHARDPDFGRWWAEHDVHRHTRGRKQLRHRVVGDLTLEYETFRPFDDPDLLLGIDLAEPNSPAQQALRRLASWAGEHSALA